MSSKAKQLVVLVAKKMLLALAAAAFVWTMVYMSGERLKARVFDPMKEKGKQPDRGEKMKTKDLLDLASKKAGSDSSLGKLVGVSRAAISMMRAGAMKIPPYRAAQFADIVGLDSTRAAIEAMSEECKTVKERRYWLAKLSIAALCVIGAVTPYVEKSSLFRSVGAEYTMVIVNNGSSKVLSASRRWHALWVGFARRCFGGSCRMRNSAEAWYCPCLFPVLQTDTKR